MGKDIDNTVKNQNLRTLVILKYKKYKEPR